MFHNKLFKLLNQDLFYDSRNNTVIMANPHYYLGNYMERNRFMEICKKQAFGMVYFHFLV